MALQTTETVNLGEIKVTRDRAIVYTIPNIGSSVALVIYDPQMKVGGIAHIVLPESSLDDGYQIDSLGKFADLAVPELLKEFTGSGGQTRFASVRMVGGAQMFNFGGGGGNLLNIGSRNATAIRAALSQNNLAIEKADIGGSKGKALRFFIATGQLFVKLVGDQEYSV